MVPFNETPNIQIKPMNYEYVRRKYDKLTNLKLSLDTQKKEQNKKQAYFFPEELKVAIFMLSPYMACPLLYMGNPTRCPSQLSQELICIN